ncbi:hypothetical protein [Caudoviricetes sp.]|nr:hypothetical protein [Caudoviricetes sp.]
MNPQTNTFLDLTLHDGVVSGEWFQVPPSGRTHIPIAISIQAGTCTWSVEGRNSPLDDAVELDTGTTDDAISVLRMAQMRVILSASSGCTFRASGDKPMREIEA